MPVFQLLAINAAVTAVCFLILWRVAVMIRDCSFIDSWWALGMGVTALTTYAVTGAGDLHAALLTGLCVLWSGRLGGYLLWRWRKNGPDRRYVTMMGKAASEKGWSYARASLVMVFALQAPLQFVVSLPVMLGQAVVAGPLGLLAMTGVALAVLGILFETVGDLQLTRFKADPANAGKVLDTGLWRYTRHPNYFGDACVWWGLWLIAADTGMIGALSVVGPVLITFLLTSWSGVPTVEGRMRRKRPDYEAYVQRTSKFFPMPPKRV